MRSLRMLGNSQITIVDTPDPTPKPGEVLVRTAVSVICGSELHTFRGPGQRQGNPGHESAGVIIALGEGVSGLALGQRVGVTAVSGCGVCADCLAGRYTWCRKPAVYGSAHAELALAPAHACIPLPDDLPWAAGVLLTGDGMGVPYHTSRKLLNPAIKNIAIFGAGPIGLGSVMLQSYLGRRVIAIDLAPERLELAHKLGAADAVDARTGSVVEQIRALTGGNGPEVCLEAVGRPETLRQALAAVRTGGIVAINGEQGKLELSPSDDFIRRDITMFGSWFFFAGEFPEMLALYRAGFPAADLITHRFPFSEAGAAYAEFAAGKTGKVMLEY
ncbi:MAG: zinc-binding dehydrogenase [Chloroflexi bacterium]|nr:zinc-binding dehydrogenase [Chloroflexota bacterium]